jgi:hypothetical protein
MPGAPLIRRRQPHGYLMDAVINSLKSGGLHPDKTHLRTSWVARPADMHAAQNKTNSLP